ncbi:MAG: T9SS type A sorting domain-containing protein [Chitinophagaceae bacterium]|nr:T9SS type A sorting domain-containing protein [Chitinophagaceae bacterium]
MKTIYTSVSKAVFTLFTIAAFTISAKAQLSFINPVLTSGTDLQPGAVYRYLNVALNTTGYVKIDSIVGGAEVLQLDDNGMGFGSGFQPMIKSGGKGTSYVVFTFTFVNTLTNAPVSISNLTTEILDIDGNNNIKEIGDIHLAGGTPSIISSGTDLSTVVSGSEIFSRNIAGTEIGGIDTSAANVMYKAIQTNVTSIRVRFGTINDAGSRSTRQYSLYYRTFSPANNVSLPLTLLNFSAILKSEKVNLSWTTTEHTDFSHFVVQRSTDGKNFKDVMTMMTDATVSSSINQYGYNDNINGVNSTVVYYRLQMVDIDGSYEYSPIRLVRLNANNSVQIQAFPNPVVNELRVMIPASWQEKTTTYEIYSSNGLLVSRTKVASAAQVQQLNVQSLGSGNYIIRVTNGQEMSSSKFVKY